MLTGVSGSLVSEHFAETSLESMFGGALGEPTRGAAWRELRRWGRRQAARLGPVSSARAVYDAAAVPLARVLGFEPDLESTASDGSLVLSRLGGGITDPFLVTTAWGQPLDAAWRQAVPLVVASGLPWCFCTNGRSLRLVDARRTLARAFLEFDLECVLGDEASFRLMWGLLRREAFAAPPLIDRVVHASSRHTVGVCRSLRHGVLQAIRELLTAFCRSRSAARSDAAWLDGAYEQALTIVYRLLFLLFAESRGLVPLWHPIYRDSYSVEALRDLAERLGAARGLWETLQAMSRLAHAGCRAGTLRVTPFNGRLFSPSATPLGEGRSVDDESVRRLVLALSTMPGRAGSGRSRIVYRDLGVEQLGAVYESVLDYRPRFERGPGVELAARARRAKGERHVLHAALDHDLSGSTHAGAARVRRAARPHPGAARARPRHGQRRLPRRRVPVPRSRVRVGPRRAQRHPPGRHLGRRPARLPPPRRAALPVRRGPQPDGRAAGAPVAVAVHARPRPAADVSRPSPHARRQPRGGVPGRSAAAATGPIAGRTPQPSQPGHAAALRRRGGRTGASGGAAGTAARRDGSRRQPRRGSREGADARRLVGRRLSGGRVEGRRGSLVQPGLQGGGEGRRRRRLLRRGRCGASRTPLAARPRRRRVARRRARDGRSARRFFHWPLEFPEVFFGGDGAPRPDAGFDAVVGNPPWDMVRGDSDGGAGRAEARREARQMQRFSRTSGLLPRAR